MKKHFLLILLSFFSLALSVSILFLITETFFRIQKKGFKDGIKSYFIVETPYSALGTNGWVIADEELSYRLNPDFPGINKYSMKNEEIIIPKPAEVKRIVILGDSVPYSGDPNLVDMLREKFRYDKNIEIINASTPGYTNYQELIFLKKYILDIEPDLVVLNYVLNDNYKFLHKFDENGKMLTTDEAKKGLLINNYLDKLVSKSYFLSRLKLALPLKNKSIENKNPGFSGKIIGFDAAWKDDSWPEFDEQLREMNDLLKKQQSKLLVVIFPIESQVKSNFLHGDFDYITKPQAKVLGYGKKHNIPTLDLFTLFYTAIDKNKEMALFTDGMHLSMDGQKLSTEEISKFIKNNF